MDMFEQFLDDLNHSLNDMESLDFTMPKAMDIDSECSHSDSDNAIDVIELD